LIFVLTITKYCYKMQIDIVITFLKRTQTERPQRAINLNRKSLSNVITNVNKNRLALTILEDDKLPSLKLKYGVHAVNNTCNSYSVASIPR
jgi:hypothetical protein